MVLFWVLTVIWVSLVTGANILQNLLHVQFAALFLTFIFVEIMTYAVCGIHVALEWHRCPVFRFGRYITTKGPGLFWIDPAFHRTRGKVFVYDSVDSLEVKSVQTHDNIPISFQLLLTKRVKEEAVRDFVVRVWDGYGATKQRAIASATETVGNSELDTILHKRDEFYAQMKDALSAKLAPWGIEVVAIELKDLKIVDEKIEQAIAMKARALKEAEAELTRAGKQLEIARKLKEAADVMTDNAWRLKGNETLIELCRSGQNNTVLIPVDLLQALQHIMGGNGGRASADTNGVDKGSEQAGHVSLPAHLS